MASHVDYYCAARAHQTWSPGAALTSYDEHSAYCPSGQRADHDWQPAGATTLIELKRRLGAVPSMQLLHVDSQ